MFLVALQRTVGDKEPSASRWWQRREGVKSGGKRRENEVRRSRNRRPQGLWVLAKTQACMCVYYCVPERVTEWFCVRSSICAFLSSPPSSLSFPLLFCKINDPLAASPCTFALYLPSKMCSSTQPPGNLGSIKKSLNNKDFTQRQHNSTAFFSW